MREEGTSCGPVVVFEHLNDRARSSQSGAFVDLRLVVTALRESEELAVGFELFLDDGADLAETLKPNDCEHRRSKDADGAANQEN